MTDKLGTVVAQKEFLGHPRGLVICFLTEMWERFSYYGMRALLIFYLTKHFLFSDQSASSIYAAYISLVYITPVIGGVVADRYLGPVKAVILGSVLLVAGHLGMAIEGAQATEVIVAGETLIQRDPLYLQIFYFSLGLIIMGVGFLKANISTLVGSMYKREDPRRDGAFTLFYMGINAGSFLGAIICGLLLEYKGFSWGFGAAGVGMLFGLLVFIKGHHLFGSAGHPKDPAALQQKILPGLSREVIIYILACVGVLICWQLMQIPPLVGGLVGVTLIIMTLTVVVYAFTKCEPIDRNRMLVCLFLMSYQIIFWSLWEQTGSSLNLMADRNVDRIVFGLELPAAMFQSVNAFFIITLAPVFNIVWLYLNRRGWEPSTPTKFALALMQLGLGFLFLVYGASTATDPSQIALIWLILLYLLHTTAELCISPVGLSMTTKLSVPSVVGMMMGCWFLAMAGGNYISGTIAAMTGSNTVNGEVVDPAAALANYMDIYYTAGIYSIGIGILALLIAPVLKHFMHGIK
tara:strand:- start:3395 stop:4954 length:1560 start_codon:yes stop_codon:yes gene_type:complete